MLLILLLLIPLPPQPRRTSRAGARDGGGESGRIRRNLLRLRRVGSARACRWHGLAGERFFYADALSALVILLTASVALICASYSIGYLRDDQQSGELGDDASGKEQLAQLRMYYTLTPLFVFSMLFMAVANNLGVMWAAMEATTLASIFLVTFYGKITSLEPHGSTP